MAKAGSQAEKRRYSGRSRGSEYEKPEGVSLLALKMEKREPSGKFRRPLGTGKGKEVDSPLKGMQLDFSLAKAVLDFWFQNCNVINLCCCKSLNQW